MTVAIVLAGGASSRFGGDKLAADLGGRPVLAHVVEAAAAVADRVILVLGPDASDPRLRGVELARDRIAHQGPLAGLVTGLTAVGGPRSREAPAIVLAGDMPRVRPDVLELLLATLSLAPDTAAACLESEPLHPLPLAVRPGPVLDAARGLLAANRRSLRALVDAVPSLAVPAARWRAIDPAGATLDDIDTPADLEGR